MNSSTDRAAQPSLVTPSDHVRVLHTDSGARVGTVSIAQVPGPGRWRERSIPLRDLAQYVRCLSLGAGSPDTYLSQARFAGRRRVRCLVTVGSLWVDLDFYRVPALASASAQDVLAAVLARCDAERIPSPSYVISSGRGLCAVWLHDPVVRAREPLWRAAEVGLSDRFVDLGMDRAPRHPAAVFRLVGSRNSKSDTAVRCIYPQVGEPEVHDFDELLALFAPVPEEPVVVARRPGRPRRVDPQVHAIRLAVSEGQLVGPWSLWARRFDDLLELRKIRFFGALPPGHRDIWLFLSACALSWMVPIGSLRRELVDLGREATGGGVVRADDHDGHGHRDPACRGGCPGRGQRVAAGVGADGRSSISVQGFDDC